jgi:hypothetical protein
MCSQKIQETYQDLLRQAFDAVSPEEVLAKFTQLVMNFEIKRIATESVDIYITDNNEKVTNKKHLKWTRKRPDYGWYWYSSENPAEVEIDDIFVVHIFSDRFRARLMADITGQPGPVELSQMDGYWAGPINYPKIR